MWRFVNRYLSNLDEIFKSLLIQGHKSKVGKEHEFWNRKENLKELLAD